MSWQRVLLLSSVIFSVLAFWYLYAETNVLWLSLLESIAFGSTFGHIVVETRALVSMRK